MSKKAKKIIYLDYAAATPLDQEAYKLMSPYYSLSFYNPSSSYAPAREIKAILDQARTTVAQVLSAKSNEIIFTAGGSEANNLAISGIMDSFKNKKLVISAIEHESIRESAKQYNYLEIGVDHFGRLDIDNLVKALTDDEIVLVSIIYANNEIGTIQDLAQISRLIKATTLKRKLKGNTTPIYLHTDAAQAGNYLDLSTNRLGVDLLSINGGKIYGPKQSGALFVKSSVSLKPLIYGGGQEFGYRSGTENVAQDIGLAYSLNKAQLSRLQSRTDMQEKRQYFINELTKLLPNSIINGPTKHFLPNIVHLTIPGIDNEEILFGLDEHNICASAGSACSAASVEPSHVLLATNMSAEDARSSIRFSMGRDTTKEELSYTATVLWKLVK